MVEYPYDYLRGYEKGKEDGQKGERQLLLQLIASLTLCDHQGDVADVINSALKKVGLELEWDTWSDLRHKLHELGITTLHGTTIGG
jgi:hypothetical protein